MWRRVILGLRAAADMILPRVCVVCGRKLLLREEHMCLFCMSDIPFTRFSLLKHNRMADRFNEVIQRHLEKQGGQPYESYAYALSLFFYDTDSNYRHIPYQIKYHGDVAAGEYFGRLLGREVAMAPWMTDVDIVIPVPLHWRRKWSRGYNQAEVIAKAVSETIEAPLRTDILFRRSHTRTQTRMNIPQKAENVKDAFEAILPDRSSFRHILLIDDVFTTGSTLGACFVALRTVFPPSVRISVATLAFVGEP